MNGLDFHGRSMTRPQACALSRPTNRLLGKVRSTGRFQPSPVKSGRLPRARSWAKSSAEAQSVTIISHFSFNAASSSESTFGPGPLNPRGAPECSVQNSFKAALVALWISMAFFPTQSSSQPNTPLRTEKLLKVARKRICKRPCLSSRIKTRTLAVRSCLRQCCNMHSERHQRIK